MLVCVVREMAGACVCGGGAKLCNELFRIILWRERCVGLWVCGGLWKNSDNEHLTKELIR